MANSGRVTTRELMVKLEYVAAQLGEVHSELTEMRKELNGRVRTLETAQAVAGQRVDDIDDDVGTLKSQSRVWSAGNSIAALLAAVFAALGLGQR